MNLLDPKISKISTLTEAKKQEFLETKEHSVYEWKFEPLPDKIEMDVLEPILKEIWFDYKIFRKEYENQFPLVSDSDKQVMDSRIRNRILKQNESARKIYQDPHRKKLFFFFTSHKHTDSKKEFMLYSTHLVRLHESGKCSDSEVDVLFQKSLEEYLKQNKEYFPCIKKSKKKTPEERKEEKKNRKKINLN